MRAEIGYQIIHDIHDEKMTHCPGQLLWIQVSVSAAVTVESSVIVFNSVVWTPLIATDVVLLGLINGGTAVARHQPNKLYIYTEEADVQSKSIPLVLVLHTDQHRATLLLTEIQERSWPPQELTHVFSIVQKACT